MDSIYFSVVAHASPFSSHKPLRRDSKAEDAYYATYSCDWIDQLILVLVGLTTVRFVVGQVTSPSRRAKFA